MGLLGSEAYVKQHFADQVTIKTTDEHGQNCTGYFHIERVRGRFRGAYCKGTTFEADRDRFLRSGLRRFVFWGRGVVSITIGTREGTDNALV